MNDKQKITVRYHRHLDGSEPEHMVYFTMNDVWDIMDEYHQSKQREILTAFYKEIEGDYLYPEEIDMHVEDFLENI